MPNTTLALTTLAIGILAPTATADFIEVRQQFEFAQSNIVDPDNKLFLFARIETDSLTGIGQESVFFSLGTLLEELNGIGQNFYFLSPPDPQGIGINGSVFGQFTDGEFDFIGTAGSGNGFTSLARNTPDGPITAVASFQNGRVIYGTVLFNNNYRLVTTDVTFIPAPGTAVVLGMGGVMGLHRRRKS